MAHHWTLIVLFSGYLPLALTILFTVSFAWFYTRRYASETQHSCLSLITVISGLSFSLLTCLLIPIDVFFASYAKLHNGTFADWAKNGTLLQDVEDTLEGTYFAFYSIVLIYLFLILPFVYFYSEYQTDPILESSFAQSFRRAILYTSVFPLALGVMLTMGAIIPMRQNSHNATDWDWIRHELVDNKGQDAFGFAFSILSALGVCTLILYLGLGMMAFPLSLIRGFASAAKERVNLREQQENLKARIAVLKGRIQMRNASQEDYQILAELTEEEAQLLRHERYVAEFQATWTYRLRRMIRPVQMIFGFMGLSLSLLVVVSLLLSNVDKVTNSDANSGYVLKLATLPNPIDYILLECQKFLSLDYVFFGSLISYLVVCCIFSIQRFGIWCCCFKAYSIRRGRTLPQALIMMCGILILCVFGLNILIYAISPQYTTFGSQHYILNDTIRPCDFDAPPHECIQTRATSLLNRFNYRMAVFGFGYYWLSWLFILVSVGGYFVFQFRSRISVAGQRDEEEDDLME
ncbi:probable lysosomal cobalamin transporter [Galendromus occidentalis]|uniref:Probable lysosomal cobalamin transporter n=1 Tax=Galendromus occidentalis TaxID=34638 RepID=A0AAJ6QRN4_9ACAR|nr:probable lysosomal cobalamin transporter [Galendromus occidentalis]